MPINVHRICALNLRVGYESDTSGDTGMTLICEANLEWPPTNEVALSNNKQLLNQIFFFF